MLSEAKKSRRLFLPSLCSRRPITVFRCFVPRLRALPCAALSCSRCRVRRVVVSSIYKRAPSGEGGRLYKSQVVCTRRRQIRVSRLPRQARPRPRGVRKAIGAMALIMSRLPMCCAKLSRENTAPQERKIAGVGCRNYFGMACKMHAK